MSYSGQVFGDSHPYQFKIPSATTTQDGVMTKDQVQQLNGAYEIAFGNSAVIGSGGTLFLGVTQANTAAALVDPRINTSERQISKISARIIGYTIPDDHTITFQLYLFDSGGAIYNPVSGAVVVLSAGQRANHATFSAQTLAANSAVIMGVTLSPGISISGVPVSATVGG